MGYNLKPTYCNLSELKKEETFTISAIFESRENSIFDLNLGSEGDLRTRLVNNLKDHKAASAMESLSSTAGSSKRARVPSSGTQVVSCLVDGCRSDLSKCRDYHRRHKVCEQHSKTPRVTIGGQEQRFCQQCSRFHSLSEFDEGKRSCRKRLEGHNRRRRKPQPESLPVNPANFLPGSQGTRFLPFTTSPIIQGSSVVSSTWSTAPIKVEANTIPYPSSTCISASYPHPYPGRQFPFLHGSDTSTVVSSSSNQPLHRRDPHSGLMETDRALSLLSSSSSTEASEMGLGRMVQPGPVGQPWPMMGGGLGYGSMGGQYSGSGEPGGSSSLMGSHMFQGGSGGSPGTTGSHQTLSFSWE